MYKQSSLIALTTLLLFSNCSKDEIDSNVIQDTEKKELSNLETKNYVYPYNKIKGYWKLQTHLPNGSGGIRTISYEDLKTYSSEIYEMNNGHVKVICPANGATTSGSSNPRTELRELTTSGQDISWNPKTGIRTLRIKFKLMEMTSAGAVATAQLFSRSNGGDQLKIQVRRQSDNSLDLQFSGDAVGPTFKAADNIKLNRWIDITIYIIANKAIVSYNYDKGKVSGTKRYTLYSGSDYYFKAGAYVLKGNSGQADVRFAVIKANYPNIIEFPNVTLPTNLP